MRDYKNSIKKRIEDNAELYNEIMTDYVFVRIRGNNEIVLENYKGILEYSDTKICVKAKPYGIRVVGTGLEIKTITDEILCIKGEFSALSYLREESGI